MKLARWTGVVVLTTALGAVAEESSIVEEEITVISTRVEESIKLIPSAISVIEKNDIQRGRQQLGLDESLNRVPGVFSQNRYNFAQDLRISIRGFGARANFGIRGVKIYADGIPSTTADGQSGVDDINLGSIERVEVTRGPNSSLYGASSGGVINLISESGPDTPFVQASVTGGEDGHRNLQLKAGGQWNDVNYMINVAELGYDGYRDHARVESTQMNSKIRWDINDRSDLTVIFNYVDSPLAEDAGGVTTAQIAEDPRQAQPRNLSSNAGEEVEQQKLGLVYSREIGDGHSMTVRNYYVWRDFFTFLPIGSHIPFVADDGVTEYERFFYGGGMQFNFNTELFGLPNQVIVGVDIDLQEDDRQRYINDAGMQGALSFDQIEEAEAFGVFIRNEIDLSDTLRLVVGARFDQIELSVDDNYLVNDDQSSSLDFEELSPTVGLVWQAASNMSVYANYGSSFETPTFTELANPSRNLNVGLGGFANVTAQIAQSVELGIRGEYWDERVQYDVAIYTMQVDDEITSISNIGNRSFFENADTDRSGVEISATVTPLEGLRVTMAYTYSDFEFDSFPTSSQFSGNQLPGLPENQAYLEVAYEHPSGIFASADVLFVDELYANNANSVVNDSSTVSNIRFGHVFELDRWIITPFIAVNNVTNTEYNSNVRINGFGGRLFEPAPRRNWYGGFTIDFSI